MSQVEATVQAGTRVSSTATFSPLGGAAADPTTVIVRVKPPTGATIVKTYGTDAEVEKVSTGVFRLRHVLDAAGTWWVSWKASSPLANGPSAVVEHAFRVEQPVVP